MDKETINLAKKAEDLLHFFEKFSAKGRRQKKILNKSYFELLSFEYNNKIENWNVVIDIFKYWVTFAFGLLASTQIFDNLSNQLKFTSWLSIILLIILIGLLISRHQILKKTRNKLEEALIERFRWEKDELDRMTSEGWKLAEDMDQTASKLRKAAETK